MSRSRCHYDHGTGTRLPFPDTCRTIGIGLYQKNVPGARPDRIDQRPMAVPAAARRAVQSRPCSLIHGIYTGYHEKKVKNATRLCRNAILFISPLPHRRRRAEARQQLLRTPRVLEYLSDRSYRNRGRTIPSRRQVQLLPRKGDLENLEG
jgi:hypothetical protein